MAAATRVHVAMPSLEATATTRLAAAGQLTAYNHACPAGANARTPTPESERGEGT